MRYTARPDRGCSARAALLASCYRRVLEEADALGARSVAFPSISTGVYQYLVEAACEIALATVADARTDVDLVRFVVFDEDNERAYRVRA